ncbi:uncharacterized protein DDB_G0283357-like isoform X2 [Physella acuta]|uniref:uncharacterized protein DDB_G0283357-like isoform X2 n=1 Tax=Physella acuta TaxID=109671 RepID=UPI0027DCE37A|nr:uncharacterized protein DDB_G0283357-like isoform X2 [Physella acuta]
MVSVPERHGTVAKALSESADKGGDQQKKLQIVITDSSIQAAGVTQKLFDSKVTFADLVRVCSPQENNQQTTKVQLGNTLLSTAHASTLVSNYLNTYRSYLDQLRKTCGRGDSLGEAISSRTATKSVPLVLPLARMTPVFSDDSREDPEFLELLKKTTTESIRKLWPHPNKTNIVRKAGLAEVSDRVEAVKSMPVNSTDTSLVSDDKTDQQTDDSSLTEPSDTCDDGEFKNDDLNTTDEDTTLTDCEQCPVYTNSLRLGDVDTPISMNSSNHSMKSSGEPLVLGDGGSTTIINKTAVGPIQKGLLKLPNDTLTAGDNFYRHSTDASTVPSWSDATQQKSFSDVTAQQSKTSIDVFLKHQQKLLQQQQLQRQILQHQQQQQQQQQQRQQQQQLLEQYQQEQQRQQPTAAQTSNKAYGFQPNDQSKNWYPSIGGGSGSTSPRSRLTSSSQSSSSYGSGTMASGQMGLDVFGNTNQMSSDYFPSNNMQGLSSIGSYMDQSNSGFSEMPTSNRTLKASYACLDPSNRMTLSVESLHDYPSDQESYLSSGELSQQERQPYGGFNQPLDDKPSCSDTSRSWAELSRPMYENEVNATAGLTIEERLRRAYARSRAGQIGQNGTSSDTSRPTLDASRQSVQRPILKINPVVENSQESPTFNTSTNQRGFELINRSNGDSGLEDYNSRYRWNSLTNCSLNSEPVENTGLRTDTTDSFMHMQSSMAADQGSRMSRLYQWKQNPPVTNDVSYLPSPRSPVDNPRMTPNELMTTSLLSNLQSDRDFSWNASSITCPLTSTQNNMSQVVDQQVFGSASISGQYKFSDSYLNKGSSYSLEPRRQMANSGSSSLMGRGQSEQPEDSGLFYDSEDCRQNTWSWKGRQNNGEEKRGNPACCDNPLSQSMQSLGNKMFSSQNNVESQMGGRKSGDENETNKTKDGNISPTEMAPQSADSLNKLRLNRAFSDPNSSSSIFRPSPHGSASMSQLTSLQQQARVSKAEESVFKISEDLEKTYLDNSKTPWHEMVNEEGCGNEYEIDNGSGSNDKYVQVQNYDGTTMLLSDQDIAALRSNGSSRLYGNQMHAKEQMEQNQGMNMTRIEEPPRPRMILGANSVKQANEEKIKAEVEESNRRLREMLGLFPNKEQPSSGAGSIRMPENCVTSQPSVLMSGQMLQQGGATAHALTTGQLSRMQMAGGKLQTSMGMAQQMYCVPNILMPPQSPNSNRQSNLVPIQGVMSNMASTSRFPQGMIRVPFVDMSRVVYVHQMPVNMTSPHPNNNHNNSSSSNPHVNTSNIITINTNDNDFSSTGQGDKSSRQLRSGGMKSKTAFIKMRSGSEEFTVPILGMRPSLDDNVCPRLIKTRTNPWDQDLDHDFSNSLMSKAVSMENITGFCTASNVPDPNIMNPEVNLMYPDMSNLQNGAPNNPDPNTKTATFMQWPASADMHPEMLDMLPVRRAMPEDCGTGRLSWPEMEFLMSSREQLQTARRSNKPMGSNKANLISIIPKGSASEGNGCGAKDTRFDKPENKF